MNELELGFEDALQNQRLIHGALKRATFTQLGSTMKIIFKKP